MIHIKTITTYIFKREINKIKANTGIFSLKVVSVFIWPTIWNLENIIFWGFAENTQSNVYFISYLLIILWTNMIESIVSEKWEHTFMRCSRLETVSTRASCSPPPAGKEPRYWKWNNKVSFILINIILYKNKNILKMFWRSGSGAEGCYFIFYVKGGKRADGLLAGQ